MYIALLGRQPALGIAELERVFGGQRVTPLSGDAAIIDTDFLDIQRLGGTLKAGRVIIDLSSGDWSKLSNKVIQHYSDSWASFDGKITLGISSYGFPNGPRDVQKIGIVLKQRLKKSGISLRLVPNQDTALSTATSHHNKLGLSDNKVELLLIRARNGRIVAAESTGAQNITAYAKRDQERPKRDAFVGMLPPKLAQIMINLAGLDIEKPLVPNQGDNLQPEFVEAPGPSPEPGAKPVSEISNPKTDLVRILDPFCGTGVILQEAALMGYSVYGTDLAEKMVRYSRDNLNWLSDTRHMTFDWFLHEGDAMDTTWQQPIDAVVAETYLGQPFSAPPSPAKLDEVRKNCNHIITEFLKNMGPQIAAGTPVCIAIPAWRAKDGSFTHLPFIATIAQLGFKPHEFHSVSQNDLLYYREDQIVARELLVLVKS
jgi:tRNA G10  N-methylase Trm11